jgi:hypothetical protein
MWLFVAAQETGAAICVKCINVCIDTVNDHLLKSNANHPRDHDCPSATDPCTDPQA